MPVTRGAGNPRWTWEETLLALDLLYRKGALDRRNSEVLELSALLRNAGLYPAEDRKDNFRNADGVALKLQNLLSALDPTRGLTSSSTDKRAVAEYPPSRSGELALVAARIREALNEQASSPARDDPDDEAEFVEGRLLTAQHRARDARLRRRLLAQTPDEALACQICSFKARHGLDRALKESFFETHHVVPLAAISGLAKTKLSDLALLCAGCHRFAHRLMARRRTWLTIEQVKAEFDQA